MSQQTQEALFMPLKEKSAIENLEADLVILGSGGGMVAAVTAAEEGVKNIIVIEKQGVLGGNTRLAGGIFACESPVQKRANIVAEKDEFFKKAMRWFHWDIVDPMVLRAFIDQSGDTIRWLEENGVAFAEKFAQSEQPRGNHRPKGRGLELMAALIKKAETMGVKILLRTQGQKILQDGSGKVSGVVAATRDGKKFEIKAKAVIIATGGFSGNTELLGKHCPDYSDQMHKGKWPYHTGDGLLMAAEAGAAIADIIPIFHIGPVPASGPWGGLANGVKAPFTVWVNKRGKRYIDESGYEVWENGNAIRLQPDMETYTLFDDAIRKTLEDQKLLTTLGWGKAPWENEIDQPSEQDGMVAELVKKGLVRQFNGWKDVAEWIGAEPSELKATINEYNVACDQGRDPIFAKAPKYLRPLRKAPYYAVRCYVHGGETMGGVRVNARMETLDTNTGVIPGLYTASVLAHGWSGQTYPGHELRGSAFGFALNSGRITGKSAAVFITG